MPRPKALPRISAPLSAPEPAPNLVLIADTVQDKAPPREPLDIEALKRSARKIEVDEMRKPAGGAIRGQTLEEKLTTGITEAKRRKCDNDYVPQVGSVKLTGLMKLPSLAKSAITDSASGCKW